MTLLGAVATVSCTKVQVLDLRFCAIDLPTVSSTFSPNYRLLAQTLSDHVYRCHGHRDAQDITA
jgi:hypothetical protein